MSDEMVIVCTQENCVWAMEDFASEDPTLIPVMQAFISHHMAEAHPQHITEKHGVDPAVLLAECREIFEVYGVNPDDPYEMLSPEVTG